LILIKNFGIINIGSEIMDKKLFEELKKALKEALEYERSQKDGLVDTDSNLGSGDGSGRLPVRRKNPKGEK
jgi:hypothetical protein